MMRPFIAILLVLAACADGRVRDRVSVRMKVAGLSPAFMLEGEPDLAELRARTRALSPTDAPAEPPAVAFTIENPDRAPGLAEEIRVGGGVVAMRTGSSIAYFRDDHGLGNWLNRRALDAGAWSRVH